LRPRHRGRLRREGRRVERDVVGEAALDRTTPLHRRLLDPRPALPRVPEPAGDRFNKTLRRIRLEDVERYYARYYRPDAWAIVVATSMPRGRRA
jgi:hypothetical protein